MPTPLRPTIISAPAVPPSQYDQRYMQELASTVRRLIQTSQNFPVLTASQLTLSGTNTESDGLLIGTVYLKTLSTGETALDIVSSADPSTETAIAVIGGNGAPASSLGLIGELYIDAQNKNLYGPKTLAGWGPAMPLGGGGSAATIAVGSTTTGAPGTSAAVNNSGTSSAAVFNFTIPRGADGSTGADGSPGAPGAPGAAATVAVGTVTTEAAGSPATVSNSGTSSAAVLDFGIPQGAQGIQGIQGPTGTPGAPGAAATVAVGTTTTGAAGSPASVTNSGSSSAAVLNFTVPQGATGATGTPGATGAAATVAVGTTTTGAAGTSASVTNSGSSSAAVLNFTVPRGNTGATGPGATVAVGTVATGAPGSSATVTNSGTATAAIFNFSIPQGQPAPTTWTGSYNANGFSLTSLGGLQLKTGKEIDFLDPTNVYNAQRIFADVSGQLTFDSAASNGAAWVNAIRISQASAVTFSQPQSLSFGSNWLNWTPVVTASGSMTVSSLVVNDAQYLRLGPIVFFKLWIQCTLGGTASNAVLIPLPVNMAGNLSSCSASVHVGTWTPAWVKIDNSNNTIAVEPSGEVNYGLGSINILVDGFYRCT